jgi:hypothetical protein
MELRSVGVRIPHRVQQMKKQMHEKVLSVCFGSVTGLISAIMIDRIIEVLILSFLGGVVGWFGGRVARWLDKKAGCLFKGINITDILMKRLWTEGKKTTIIGLIILICSLIFIAMGKITASEFAMLMPFILILFRVKDTVLGNFGTASIQTTDITKSKDA